MPQLQLIADLPGHPEPAWQVSFNPTRPLLASCSTDRTVRLYSYTLPSSTQCTTTYPLPTDPRPAFSLVSSIPTKHTRSIRSVVWAPSGRTFATGSFDSTVGVWEEVDPGDEDEDGHEGVFRPAKAAALGDDEEEDMRSEEEVDRSGKEWECVTTLEGHESECKSIGFSHDGGLLASCSRDKSVWIWEVQPDADFECIAVMMDHSQDVKCISWHPKEEILASASYDSHIHLMFDDPDGDWCIFQKLHPKLPASPLIIPSPTSSPSLVAALVPNDQDKAVANLHVPPLEEDETVWCLAWSPCGKYLASGGDLGGIRIWARKGSNPDSLLEEQVHIAAHSRSVFSLSWTADTTQTGSLGSLASAGGDGKIIVCQVTLPTTTEDSSPPSSPSKVMLIPVAAVRDAHGVNDVNSVGWCVREDGRGHGLLASCGDEGGVKVWRVAEE